MDKEETEASPVMFNDKIHAEDSKNSTAKSELTIMFNPLSSSSFYQLSVD